MKTSESIAQLADALAKAHGEFKPLVKDMVNPFFKNRYASLASCHDSTKDALCKYGIIVVQGQVEENNKEYCETRVIHKSGEWISSLYPIRRTKEDAQGFGGGFTYALRYSYMGMLNLAPEDDDGELAAGRITEIKEKTKPTVQQTSAANPKINPPAVKKPISEIPNEAEMNAKIKTEDIQRLMGIANSAGWKLDEVSDYVGNIYGVPLMKDLTRKQANDLKNIFTSQTYKEAIDDK